MILEKDNIQAFIGKHIGVSDWFEVTQDDVNAFADLTLDHQFIHIDPELAAETPFGGTIAHGFFTMSMLSHFALTGCGVTFKDVKMGVNYGCDKLRFLSPVRVGSKIRGSATLESVEEKKPGQYMVRSLMTVEIEGSDTPALIAEWLTMVVV